MVHMIWGNEIHGILVQITCAVARSQNGYLSQMSLSVDAVNLYAVE